MNIVVLIAGVHDPRWPITPEAATDSAAGGEHCIMSPFDEAALEMALRIRDARSDTAIAVRVAGGEGAMRVARSIASLNISDVATFAVETPWDQVATARALAQLSTDAELILMGREFGDFDDGLVPSLLAGLLKAPFFGRAQTIEAQRGIAFMREAGSHSERLLLSDRAVVSVTNDRRTRLRKPLMKNVMQARQAVIRDQAVAFAPCSSLALNAISPSTSGRGKTDCTILPGTPEQQAHALAALLWEARV